VRSLRGRAKPGTKVNDSFHPELVENLLFFVIFFQRVFLNIALPRFGERVLNGISPLRFASVEMTVGRKEAPAGCPLSQKTWEIAGNPGRLEGYNSLFIGKKRRIRRFLLCFAWLIVYLCEIK
jgi:hypothetical protein